MKFLVQDIYKMQSVVDKFLKDNNIDVRVNVILTNSCDRACSHGGIFQNGQEIFFIKFNDSNWINMSQGNNAESILNTLIHECIHILAYYRKLKPNDGDYDFEKLLFDYGVDSNFLDFELENMYEQFLNINLNDREENFNLIKDKYLNLLV